MATDIGTGWTLTMGTSDYGAEITQLDADGKEVPVIDISHMGTTGSRVKMVGDLVDEGSINVSIHFDSSTMDELEAAFGVSQTMTLTAPLSTGGSTAGTIAGTGAMTKHNWTAPLEDKMVGNYTITWLGAVTMTDQT